jgi:hypothetical protein
MNCFADLLTPETEPVSVEGLDVVTVHLLPSIDDARSYVEINGARLNGVSAININADIESGIMVTMQLVCSEVKFTGSPDVINLAMEQPISVNGVPTEEEDLGFSDPDMSIAAAEAIAAGTDDDPALFVLQQATPRKRDASAQYEESDALDEGYYPSSDK